MNEMTKTTPAARGRGMMSTSPMGWLRTEIDRLFDDFGGNGRSLFDFGPSVFPTSVAPALELIERDKDYCLTAELPGLTEKDITINVADGVLTISGEKKEEQERSGNGYILNERRYGSFERQIAVPSDVNPDNIKAQFQNGVLTLTLAKNENAAPRSRKIEIGK